MWVTGRHPVEELLRSPRQKPSRVLLAAGGPESERKEILALAARAGVPVTTCPKEEWQRRTGDREGGGIAAELQEFRPAEFREWLASLPQHADAYLLDGVTDPQNLGAILRNARAFGIAGVVVPRDRSCPVTAAVFRSSAGAAAHVPVVPVTNLARAIGEMKESGFWVYAATRDGEADLSGFSPPARTALVLGSEGTGIRRLVREGCDGTIRIGIEPGVDSLNVAAASGILGWALRTARRRAESR